MSMGMEVAVFLAYAAGMLIVYVFGRFLLVPLKWMLRIIGSSIAGGILILLINYFGNAWGIMVPLNIITAFMVGVLGLPGIVSLALIFI